MQRDKKEVEHVTELEPQMILRLPEGAAKTFRELLKSGDNIKDRLTIKMGADMRHCEVKLDEFLIHAKIVHLPTITESLKTIDNKNFYEDQVATEEEASDKNKKQDPNKVDKKFLLPHGITPPTKNVRKKRFRKTMKKKYVEAPEIEKEVKREGNEAERSTYEVIYEEDDQYAEVKPVVPVPIKQERKKKAERAIKKETITSANQEPSNVVDIFGGAVSESDGEDNINNINVKLEKTHLSANDSQLSDNSSVLGLDMHKRDKYPTEFNSQKLRRHSSKKGKGKRATATATSTITSSSVLSLEADVDY